MTVPNLFDTYRTWIYLIFHIYHPEKLENVEVELVIINNQEYEFWRSRKDLAWRQGAITYFVCDVHARAIYHNWSIFQHSGYLNCEQISLARIGVACDHTCAALYGLQAWTTIWHAIHCLQIDISVRYYKSALNRYHNF